MANSPILTDSKYLREAVREKNARVSGWVFVACVLAFSCAQPKAQTVDKPARMIPGSCAYPDYPPEARRAGQTGDVTVKLFVDAKGDVTDTGIEKSSGYPMLDDAAAAAMKKCRFEPAVKNAVAVESQAKIVYQWKLADADARETPAKLIAGSCQLPKSEGGCGANSCAAKAMVSVDSRGTVTNVELKKSSGSSRFDNAGLRALRTCQFEPATAKGTPVDATILFDWKE